MTLYTVTCDFKDGTRDVLEGLTFNDVLALVRTFDNLPSLVSARISLRREER